MKIVHLLFIVVLGMSSWGQAGQQAELSGAAQQRVDQFSQEMNGYGIPEDRSQRMFTMMYENGYLEGNIHRAAKAVQSAARAGLPTEPVMNKAMEGMAKGVPQNQVVEAMERVRDRYEYAYRQARSLSADRKNSQALGQAVADCLAAGMTRQEMEAIAAKLQARTHRRTKEPADDLSLQTMQTVRSMKRLGAKATDVENTVSQALQNRFTARQMEQMRNQFRNDAQHTAARQLVYQYAHSFNNGPGGKGSSGGDSGGSGSGGSGSGGNGSGGNGSGGNGSGGNGSGGNGSGGNGSGGNGSGGNGSGGNGSGGNGSGGNGSGGNGGGR